MVQIATKRMDICNCEKCKYRGKRDNKCRFGLRDIGCYMNDKIVKEISNDFLIAFEKGITPVDEELLGD